MENIFEYEYDEVGVKAMRDSLNEFRTVFSRSTPSLATAFGQAGLKSWDKSKISRLAQENSNITNSSFHEFKSAYSDLFNLANNAKKEKIKKSGEKVAKNRTNDSNKYKTFFIEKIFPEAVKKLIEKRSVLRGREAEQNKSFLEKVEDQYCVDCNDIIQFIISNPTILFSWFDERFEYSYDNKERINLVSPIYVWDPSKISRKVMNYHNGKGSKKVQFKNKKLLIGHSLSIIEDSICLLYDLGRAKRMEELFDSKLNIYLTATDWATYNRSANVFFPNKDEREIQLEICLINRQKLYGELKIDFDIIHYYGIDAKQKNIKNGQLSQKASDLKEKSKAYGYVDDLNDKGIEDLILVLEEEIKNNTQANKSDLYFIYSTLKHFHALDTETFVYTLIQRNTQEYYYKKYIKLAVESELRFDNSFCKMDFYEGKKENKNCAIYYKHYYFVNEKTETSKNSIPQNVIPYTTTAGRVGLGLNDIEKIKEKIVLLSDFNNKEKIVSIVNKMDLKQIAIQMCDLFSFCNYFFSEESEFWRILDKRLNQFDGGDCTSSWDRYANEKENFVKYILTPLSNTVNYIPYFFYPFIYQWFVIKTVKYI
jgi:hypothetical protein